MGAAAPTLAAVVANVTPVEKTIRICLDGRLLAQIAEAEEAYQQARLLDESSNSPDQAPALQQGLVDQQHQAEQGSVAFTFTSNGRTAWRELVAKHPPTKEQRDKGADVNIETFPVAAMAACCTSPAEVDSDGLTALSSHLTQGQWDRLWGACLDANTLQGDIPNFEAAFVRVRPTATS